MSLDHLAAAEEELRAFALALPEAYEEFPWGERALKVRGKSFVFMRRSESDLVFSAKLPQSNGEALILPFAQPTGYGLGKAGWVTARFQAGDMPLVGLLRDWTVESYRAVAPKTLAKRLDGAFLKPS